MKATRVELSGATIVECELVALKQMHKALKGLADGDYSAEDMRGVLAELVAGPLLQNAASTDEVPWCERHRLSKDGGEEGLLPDPRLTQEDAEALLATRRGDTALISAQDKLRAVLPATNQQPQDQEER